MSAPAPGIEIDPRLVSILVPAFNEEDSLRPLLAEIRTALSGWDRPYEVVFVDDGSTDRTASVLEDLAREPGVGVIRLRRNFGQTAALTAAIDHSRGGVLAPLDADLQNDPADIPRLVAKLDEGYDVVSGWRRDRKDANLTRKIPSRLANSLISWSSGVRLHDYGCSLKAYRREVIADVRLYGEMHRFIPIYASMQGGKVTELEVNHRPRRFGVSKYGLGRIGKVLLDLMLVKFLASFAAKPIYVFGGFGLGCLAFSFIPMALAAFFKVMPESSGFHKDLIQTPLPVLAAVFLVTGFLSLLMGLQSEMLMRTYYESQGKRTYIVGRATSPRDPT